MGYARPVRSPDGSEHGCGVGLLQPATTHGGACWATFPRCEQNREGWQTTKHAGGGGTGWVWTVERSGLGQGGEVNREAQRRRQDGRINAAAGGEMAVWGRDDIKNKCGRGDAAVDAGAGLVPCQARKQFLGWGRQGTEGNGRLLRPLLTATTVAWPGHECPHGAQVQRHAHGAPGSLQWFLLGRFGPTFWPRR